MTAMVQWLRTTGVIAIPTGHQLAFLLLGEPIRLVGQQHICPDSADRSGTLSNV